MRNLSLKTRRWFYHNPKRHSNTLFSRFQEQWAVSLSSAAGWLLRPHLVGISGPLIWNQDHITRIRFCTNRHLFGTFLAQASALLVSLRLVGRFLTAKFHDTDFGIPPRHRIRSMVPVFLPSRVWDRRSINLAWHLRPLFFLLMYIYHCYTRIGSQLL